MKNQLEKIRSKQTDFFMDNSTSPFNPLAAITGTFLSTSYRPKERSVSGAAAPGEIGETVYR